LAAAMRNKKAAKMPPTCLQLFLFALYPSASPIDRKKELFFAKKEKIKNKKKIKNLFFRIKNKKYGNKI
jgi:hypothetical protein